MILKDSPESSLEKEIPEYRRFGIRALFRDVSRAFFLALSMLLLGAMFALVFFRIGTGEAATVLRYNAYFGIDLIGTASQAFLVPTIAGIFLALPALFALFALRWNEPTVALLFTLSGFLLQVVAFIATVALLLVN